MALSDSWVRRHRQKPSNRSVPPPRTSFFFLSRRAKRLSPFAHREKRASAQKREVLTPAVNTVCVACVWKMMRLFMSSFQHLVGGVRQNFLRHSDWHLLQSLPPFSTAAREWWPGSTCWRKNLLHFFIAFRNHAERDFSLSTKWFSFNRIGLLWPGHKRCPSAKNKYLVSDYTSAHIKA